MFRYLLIVILCAAEGCISSSKGGDSGAVASQVDNSVHGVSECTFSCEPVDIANCNDVADAGPICFLVSAHCQSPSDESGPDLTTVPPPGCVQVPPLPSDAGGNAVVGLDAPAVPVSDSGLTQGF